VRGQDRSLILRGEDTLKTMGIPDRARTPILEVTIRNRGRRAAEIKSVNQARSGGGMFVFGDLLPQVPFEIPAERTKVLAMGAEGGYQHGEIALKRFFALDGADRIHPLRERFRQKLRRAVRLGRK